MKPQQPEPDKSAKTIQKRTYVKPKLEVYGELGQITESVGKSGASEGGPPNKQTKM
jgi:hypothetical protein